MPKFRPRQRLGKYRIERRIGAGGFADVYRALDTIEGRRVAIKVPHDERFSAELMDDILREVRITARLEHPNILPLRSATFIDGVFVIVHPLAETTLADRLARRLAPRRAMSYASQLLDAVAHAHEHRVIHCDIKPENVLLFPGDVVRLSDFGIAKVALRTRTITAAGTGTIGYLAPEQAFGKPTFRSDVFALGLVIYRMLAGTLPEWPYDWPPPGIQRLRRTVSPDFIEMLRRAIPLHEKARYANASVMRRAFRRLRRSALRSDRRRRARARPKVGDWNTQRYREFQRLHRTLLSTRLACSHCQGPVAESMQCCPWCGRPNRAVDADGAMPSRCPRCGRGAKRDWPYCAWCYGGRIQEPPNRQYPDRRYSRNCSECRGQLLPFSRYCPWCRRKVRRSWTVEALPHRCPSCRWSVTRSYWSWCPWCQVELPPVRSSR